MTAALVRVAKQRGMAVIIIGHVTKDGNIAGPRLLEHLVDVVLAFEGDRHSGFRLIRATKNRFGPADEVGCFEMARGRHRRGARPLRAVHLPPRGAGAGHLRHRHHGGPPTAARRAAGAGRQVTAAGAPAHHARCRLRPAGDGARGAGATGPESGCTTTTSTCRPSAGPGSSTRPPIWPPRSRWPPAPWTSASPQRCVAIGEVGLAGELRRVPGIERRLAEAARLGFTEAVIPADARQSEQIAMSPTRAADPRRADRRRCPRPPGYPSGRRVVRHPSLTSVTRIGRRPVQPLCLRWRTEDRSRVA